MEETICARALMCETTLQEVGISWGIYAYSGVQDREDLNSHPWQELWLFCSIE